MFRPVVAVLTAALLSFCLFFAGCSQQAGLEEGKWKLEFFSDGEANYRVGDEYGGQMVTEDLYTCTFGGGKYVLYRDGEPVLQGGYTAQPAGDSVMLTLDREGGFLYWNCGIRTDAGGVQTVALTGSVAGITFSFVAA